MSQDVMTIDKRTQELIALRAGMLMLANARLQAELEAAAAAERRGPQDGAQGADGPEKEGS